MYKYTYNLGMDTSIQTLTKQLHTLCEDSKLDPQQVCQALQTCFTAMNADKPQRLVDYEYKGLRIEIERMVATKNGVPLVLSASQWKILVALIRANGKKLSKSDLHTVVYGSGAVRSNTLEVFLSHLRSKIGDEFIITHRGQGYVINNLTY